MKHQWKNNEAAFGMPDFTYCVICNAVQWANTSDEGCPGPEKINESDIVYRLRRRAEIRRQIPDRKSVQQGKPDRIADLLEEAANEIESLRAKKTSL